MKYVSIDLSQRSTGITLTNETGELLSTFTIKNLLETKYKEADINQIKQAVEKLRQELITHLTKESMDLSWTLLIEYNINPLNVKFEKFSLSFIFYLCNLYKNVKIIPIQASRWMTIANNIFSIKRDKYPKTKEGNKKWISDIVKHLAPNHKFNTQDEKDSYLMLKTFLEKKDRF